MTTKLSRTTVFLYCLSLVLSIPILAQNIFSPQQLAEKVHDFNFRYSQNKIDLNNPLTALNTSNQITQAVEREWLLNTQLKSLDVQNLTLKTRLWLQQLRDYKSITKTWLLDGNYKIEIAAWPIAAQAKGMLLQWEIHQSQLKSRQYLEAGNWQFLLQNPTPNQQQGYLNAVKSSPVELLSALTEKLLQPTQLDLYQLHLLWIIANRTQQLALLEHVINHADARFSITIMKQQFADKTIPKDIRKKILSTAINNPHLASSAILQLSEFIDNDARVAELVLNQLANDKLGGSAARALSESTSPWVTKQLSRLQLNEKGSLGKRARQILLWQQQMKLELQP